MEVILFGDVEAAAVSVLSDAFGDRSETATVAASIPTPRPTRLVVIRAVGGVRRDVANEAPRLMYDAWAPKASEACALADLARALLVSVRGQSVGTLVITRVDDTARPVPLTDPKSGATFYRGEVTPHVRGVPE